MPRQYNQKLNKYVSKDDIPVVEESYLKSRPFLEVLEAYLNNEIQWSQGKTDSRSILDAINLAETRDWHGGFRAGLALAINLTKENK